MVSDCTNPATAGVEVTVAFVRTLAALACQISDVPGCVLARFTRLHVSPAPDTVIVCAPAAIGPSDATNASSSSGAADVVIVLVRVPEPSAQTTASTARALADWTTRVTDAVWTRAPLVAVIGNG